MTVLREGSIEYVFDDSWTVSKYDQWPFYRKHFVTAFGGAKAVDVMAQDPDDTLWLVEIKDYSSHDRTKRLDLCDEISIKVRDSLAGVVAAAKWHSHHPNLIDARKHLSAKKLRVVLHIEQPPNHNSVLPRGFNTAKLRQRIHQSMRSVDPHPIVVDLASFKLPWQARRITVESRITPAQ